jgi:hypothetical protein
MANLSMYQFFAADFPEDPKPIREYHLAWGNRYAVGTLLLIAGFAYTLGLLFKKKNASESKPDSPHNSSLSSSD